MIALKHSTHYTQAFACLMGLIVSCSQTLDGLSEPRWLVRHIPVGGVGSAQVWLCGSPLGENGCPVSESIGSVTKENATVKV